MRAAVYLAGAPGNGVVAFYNIAEDDLALNLALAPEGAEIRYLAGTPWADLDTPANLPTLAVFDAAGD